MSDLPPPPPPVPPPPAAATCPNCGAPVGLDQDWCLNCGQALTTQVAAAGGWRTPIAIVAAVLLIAAAALVFAFVQLSGEAGKDANRVVAGNPTPTPTTAPVTGVTGPSGTTGPSGATGPTGALGSPTPVPVTPTPTTSSGVGSWPSGASAYTVILFSETSRAAARSKAQTVTGLPDVGILRSDDFSTLRSGYWVVFSGQYDSVGAATKAADASQSQAPGAYPKQVKPK